MRPTQNWSPQKIFWHSHYLTHKLAQYNVYSNPFPNAANETNENLDNSEKTLAFYDYAQKFVLYNLHSSPFPNSSKETNAGLESSETSFALLLADSGIGAK